MQEVVTTDAMAKLNELSRKSESIQAAIAYWTIPPDDLDLAFSRAISRPGGFLCCDIHSPTSIDCLADFRRRNANVYLLLYQLVGRTEVPDAKGTPDHLMHSKVLVFNTSATECAIWVGSHNATKRALMGINFECAVVSYTARGSSLHRQVDQHLDAIRQASTAFDLNDIQLYRDLQGGSNATGFIEVQQDRHKPLEVGTEVTFFGSLADDYRNLKKVDSELCLSVTGAASREHLYRVSIKQTGALSPNDRRALNFSPRQFAYKADSTMPELMSHGQVPDEVYGGAVFFVAVKIDAQLHQHVALEAPTERPWTSVAVDLLPGSGLPGTSLPPGSRLQAPTTIGMRLASQHAPAEWRDSYSVLSLPGRQALQTRSLFRRRLLVLRT